MLVNLLKVCCRWVLVAALLTTGQAAWAHPMPTSRVLLDLQATGVAAEVQLPLGELQLALGQQFDVTTNPANLVARSGAALRAYISAHVRAASYQGQVWAVIVNDLQVSAAEQTDTGPYQELTARLWLRPPAGVSSRAFVLHYDAIMHQLVTHAAFVSIRQDWDTGVLAAHPVQVGVIRMNPRDNSIAPLYIEPAGGSRWRGFRSMVSLGMSHIAEGTDHLLFLLVLLLPAPLLVRFGRWGRFGGVRYSGGRLLKIVTAFTLGHSLTLLLGALGWVRLPGQPVEVLIAGSILVSAVHAWRPLFAGREAWVAAGFGLVHGLAFASTLAGLHLDAGRMALSILGFNLGIELMQLFVIVATVPWLLLLSLTPAYPAVRVGGAALASLAALAWIAERLSGQPNALTLLVAQSVPYAGWLLGALVVGAVGLFWRTRISAA
jgi:hypothetical protein